MPSALFPTTLSSKETSFIETDSQRSLVIVNKVKRSLLADEYRVGLEFSTRDLRRAVVSLVLGPEYLPIAVVREEMRAWKLLRLNPEELRKPSSAQGPRFLSPSGGNLPTMLAHMQLEDEFVLTDISRDMASLIADIYEVKVERNSARDEYDVWIETSDHRLFSSAVLSDGTLRLLALVAVKNDPQFQGLLCLEEPENSVHPSYTKQMARLLRKLATNFADERAKDEPLKQIMITTHSPIFVGLPEIVDSLLLAFMPLQAGNKELIPSQVTRMVPVVSPQEVRRLKAHPNKALELYTLDTVRQFLSADVLREADRSLKKARTSLVEDEE